MLSYDAHDDSAMLYLFDEPGRIEAKKQLYDDIPRLIYSYGDAINVGDFYRGIYNDTPPILTTSILQLSRIRILK